MRLLDASGDFVAIAAPSDVGFYVHGDLVRRVEPGEGATVLAGSSASAAREGAEAAVAPGPATAPAAAPDPGAKLLRARDLYLAELAKTDFGIMDFSEVERLFEEAARQATTESLRAAAISGLRRVRVAVRLQADYRRRMGPIERMIGEREP